MLLVFLKKNKFGFCVISWLMLSCVFYMIVTLFATFKQTVFLQALQTAALLSVLGLSAPHSHLSVVPGSDDIES